MTMEPEELKAKIRGIIPVQYCPYTKDLELDLDGLRENTEFLVDFAEDGDKDVVILTNGSTTEFYANSIEEQKKVIKTVVDTADGKVPVAAGVSQAGAIKTIEMVEYAEKAGVDVGMVVNPYYHSPTKEGMYRYIKKVADAANIPIMLYNNPDVSGIIIPPDLMERLSKIDNVVAAKDNAATAPEYAFESASVDPKDMTLIMGQGEMHYIGAASYGNIYKGFVSGFANFAPSLSYEVYEAVKERDFEGAFNALKKQMPLWSLLPKFNARRESISIIPECQRTNYMYMSLGKAALDLVGLNGGPLRLPLEELTDEEKQELKSVLEDLGLVN